MEGESSSRAVGRCTKGTTSSGGGAGQGSSPFLADSLMVRNMPRLLFIEQQWSSHCHTYAFMYSNISGSREIRGSICGI